MPSRILRDTMPESESLARCSAGADDRFPRYLLAADDYGCFLRNTLVLKGRLWPLRATMTPEQIESDLSEYEREGMLQVWEDGGKRWCYFVSWPKHQRNRPNAKRKTPAPPQLAATGGMLQRPAASGGYSSQSQSQSQSQEKQDPPTDLSRSEPRARVNETASDTDPHPRDGGARLSRALSEAGLALELTQPQRERVDAADPPSERIAYAVQQAAANAKRGPPAVAYAVRVACDPLALETKPSNGRGRLRSASPEEWDRLAAADATREASRARGPPDLGEPAEPWPETPTRSA